MVIRRSKPGDPFYNRYSGDNELSDAEIEQKQLEEDMRMDELMEMPEDQAEASQDAEFDVALREHKEWWDSLTLAQQVANSRRNALRSCITNRILMQQFPPPEEWDEKKDGQSMYERSKESLRKTQIRLLKIREWRKTGIYPGGG